MQRRPIRVAERLVVSTLRRVILIDRHATSGVALTLTARRGLKFFESSSSSRVRALTCRTSCVRQVRSAARLTTEGGCSRRKTFEVLPTEGHKCCRADGAAHLCSLAYGCVALRITVHEGDPPRFLNSYGSVPFSPSSSTHRTGDLCAGGIVLSGRTGVMTSTWREPHMRNSTDFKSLIVRLRTFEDSGRLEPEQRETFAKAITRLEHALKVGKARLIQKAVNDLARLFLRMD